jgi:hypothetical protein
MWMSELRRKPSPARREPDRCAWMARAPARFLDRAHAAMMEWYRRGVGASSPACRRSSSRRQEEEDEEAGLEGKEMGTAR